MSRIDKNVECHSFLFDLCNTDEIPDTRDKDSAGTFLHSYYNGIENIATIILKAHGEYISNDFQWHSNLFNKLFNDSDQRPAILQNDYKEELKLYMTFRHRFRHTYSYEIDWDDAKPLVEGSARLWEKIKKDINIFIDSN